MVITKLSDTAVRWLLPRTTAGACRPPEPCDNCANSVIRCESGARIQYWYTLKMSNCSGACFMPAKRVCRELYLGAC
jgi:hypothetical protein